MTCVQRLSHESVTTLNRAGENISWGLIAVKDNRVRYRLPCFCHVPVSLLLSSESMFSLFELLVLDAVFYFPVLVLPQLVR